MTKQSRLEEILDNLVSDHIDFSDMESHQAYLEDREVALAALTTYIEDEKLEASYLHSVGTLENVILLATEGHYPMEALVSACETQKVALEAALREQRNKLRGTK